MFAPLRALVLVLWLSAAGFAADQFQGITVKDIRIQASTPEDESRLKELLAIRVNEPYALDKIRESIERLYATGRFSDIQVDAQRREGAVTLTFITKENFFVGGVYVEGSPERLLQSQMVSATKLELGELYTEEKLQQAQESVKRVLADDGYYQAKVETKPVLHPEIQQVDLHFHVTPGERARIATVEIRGNPVLTPDKIMEKSGLKPGKEVTGRRIQNALNKLRKYYQSKDRLEAEVAIAERRYLASENKVAIVLNANAGPEVDIKVDGAKVSKGKKRQLIPIYDEGTVDADLIREGEINLRDDFQKRGFYEVQVNAHTHTDPKTNRVQVEYHVKPGTDHDVELIEITGNKYFNTPTLRERMFMTENTLLGEGRYSRQYLNRDIEAIKSLYISNGFPHVQVTANITDNYQGKEGDMAVRINIEEGPQVLVSNLWIEGNRELSEDDLKSRAASSPGQPYSEFNILLDRDTILNHYYNQGFAQATFTPEVRPVPGRPDSMDLVYRIHEGPRQYVNRVIISGLENTRRYIVNQQILVKNGQPLNQEDLLRSQRNLYDLGVFQKVDMALQNQDGQEQYKNVLFHFEEARRWTVSVGGGADVARIGGDDELLSESEGRTGFSPRVSLDVTRLNFRGRNHTVALKTRVSTLQQRGLLSYTAPRIWNRPALTLVFNALYDTSFDVTTFRSQRMEGSVALEQRRSRSDTMFYRYSYRRVRAQRDTLKVSLDILPLFARPVRVGMLSWSFVRDRRDDPVDSRRGMFFTFDAGIAARQVGSAASFGRSIMQFTTYHRLRPNLVLARNTQFGIADPFGKGRLVDVFDEQNNPVLDPEGNPVRQLVRDVPLPERFFSGGSNSHRGFAVNQAGPRDLATGFPIGGGALFMNSAELRFPLIGPNIGGALFHDLGNVFRSVNDISFRLSQRDRTDFNYLVQAVGFGIRYKTPIGPVRLDLAWSINPPRFVGLAGTRRELLAGTGRREDRQLSHLQFFFSIGQTY